MTASASPRWRVTHEEYSGGGLYELETRSIWRVVDTRTDEVLYTFVGGSSASYQTDGSGWGDRSTGGVVAVELTEDGRSVVATEAGGHVRRIDLPE